MSDSIAQPSSFKPVSPLAAHSAGLQSDTKSKPQLLWASASVLQTRLEVYFRHVEQTRMDGVFLLNPALQVQAIGFEKNTEGDWWQGILIAPWFMNILRFPVHTQVSVLGRGKKAMARVWGERFAFIGAYEPGVGPYEMCSLFSSMFEFSDQLGAQAVAQAILQDLREQEQQQQMEQQTQTAENRKSASLSEEDAKVASRRRFLLGRGRTTPSPSAETRGKP